MEPCQALERFLPNRTIILRLGGDSMGVHLTAMLQFRVRFRQLPRPRFTLTIWLRCHLGWNLSAGWLLLSGIRPKMYFNNTRKRKNGIFLKYEIKLISVPLKELSHEIEMGC
jgi:hypothetical protein